jgi:2-hydroxy-3-keto-5-methylthiopentenyl-1-phosphate phosphatase
MTPQPEAAPGGVLVSDFDGTMTRHDFYKLAIESLLSPDTPDYWAEYRAGTITHFEALRQYFAAIRNYPRQWRSSVGPDGRWWSPPPAATGTSDAC